METDKWNIADEDTEGDDELKSDFYTGRDCLIFMVDCSKSMFTVKIEDENGEQMTHFEASIKAIHNVYNMKCVTNDRNYVGVLFYNTEKSKNSHKFDNVYVLHEVGKPGAEHVKELESFLTDEGKKDFQHRFGHGEAKLDEALWMAGIMFSSSQVKEGTKRIMLFTNSEKPHRNDTNMQRRVIQKIRDLRDQSVDIDLLPLGENFDWSAFYQAAFEKSPAECTESASRRFSELMDRTLYKAYKKRSLATLTFSLGPGIELGIGLYNMIAEAKIPTPQRIEAKTNEPVQSTRTFMEKDTAEKHVKVDLKKYQTYGGVKVALEQAEVDQMKRLWDTGVVQTTAAVSTTSREQLPAFVYASSWKGLVLLGFKPISYLKPYEYVSPGCFVYPAEKHTKGSAKLFRALLEKCAEKKKMAVCRLVARQNMAPRLVALLPQLEELDNSGSQISPPGFNVVYLPYADDIRDLQKIADEPRAHASPDQVDKARAIVHKLKLKKFTPETIANPALQKHFRAVEAIALERETVDEVDDTTKPNIDWMKQKAGDELEDFKKAVFSGDQPLGGKRKKASAAPQSTSKKAKSENIDLEAEARAHQLDKLTVPVLRELCAQMKIKLSGTRKAEIIHQIYRHFDV